MARLPWLLVIEVTSFVLVCSGSAAGRAWLASPEGLDGDGTVVEILAQVADGDTLILAGGVHQWPDVPVTKSLVVSGDERSAVTGPTMDIRDCEFFELRNLQCEGLSSGLNVLSVGRFVIEDCEYRNNTQAYLNFTESVLVRRSSFADNHAPVENEHAGLVVTHGSAMIEDCVFVGNETPFGLPLDESGRGGGAVVIGSYVTSAEIRRCVFLRNVAGSGSAVHCSAPSGRFVFEENTVVENECLSGAIVLYSGDGGSVIRQNVFAGNAAYALWLPTSRSAPEVYCNAFWQNNTVGLGVYGGREENQWAAIWVQGQHGERDFRSVLADPMFCDSLVVSEASELAHQELPCLPIGGARGLGCGVEPVLGTSWGELKKRLGR